MHEMMIERLAYRGEGIGRIDGKVCFVQNALPANGLQLKFCRIKRSISRPGPLKSFPAVV